MAKTQPTARERVQLDVAGALQTLRAKKSREQIKIERFLPFVAVIDEALLAAWSWSAIIKLIREHGGPTLTKKEAEDLYAQLRSKSALDRSTETGEEGLADDSMVQKTGAKEEVTK